MTRLHTVTGSAAFCGPVALAKATDRPPHSRMIVCGGWRVAA